MKTKLRILLFAAIVALLGTACVTYVPTDGSGQYNPPYNDEDAYRARYDNLDNGFFYDELQPYGIWVSYRPYGYVWIPRDVGYSWRPYTRGYWAWTDYGWTWVSAERWGWIAFHYGRWGWDRHLGWFWVPDIVWGPAWVAWRWGDAHVGWAPLPPGAEFIPGRGFGPGGRWDIPGHYWCFVRGRDFTDRSIDRWVLPQERNSTLIGMTHFEVNISERDRRIVDDGVDVDWVRGQTSRTVERLSLKDSTRPGPAREEGRELVVSKPQVKRNDAARPKEVVDQAKAEQDLSETSGRIYRHEPKNEEQIVREEHEQERQLMKESQETEMTVIRRRAQEEQAKVQNPAEKKKVEDQTSSRLAELKKKHEQEKAELDKRHKAEEEKAKKAPVRKKTEPDKD